MDIIILTCWDYNVCFIKFNVINDSHKLTNVRINV